jgi:hypothetical protein
MADAAVNDSSADHDGHGSGHSSSEPSVATLLGELASDPGQDLTWLFEDPDKAEFAFGGLSAGDLSTTSARQNLDNSASGASSEHDLGDIDWLLGSHGDMFVFTPDNAPADMTVTAQAMADEAVALPLDAVDVFSAAYHVELVGVYDIVTSDHIL